MLSMFLNPSTVQLVMSVSVSTSEKIVIIILMIIMVIGIWIIYDLRKAPLITEEQARKIEKAERHAAES